MDNNVFEKLDAQGEKIDQVADKLDGVSIDDLYALAKRTWDYQDYEMAQKYYNHISLLRPLDWKAPFCASLCGCLGPYETYLWDRRPKEVFRYFQATVNYIRSRDVPDDEKNVQIKAATEIVSSVLKEHVRIYAIPENKKAFDDVNPAFKRELQKAHISVISLLETAGQDYQTIAASLADLLSEYCITDRSIAITNEDFEKYVAPLDRMIDYEAGIDNSVPISAEQKTEQEKEIKLKGKCYLVFKDTILEKRYRRKNAILAIILLLATGCTTLIPLLSRTDREIALSAIWLIPSAIIALIRGIGNRNGFRMDSILNRERHKYRLQSDGNLICEEIFSPAIVCGVVLWSITVVFSIFSVSALGTISPLLLIVMIVALAVECVCVAIIGLFDQDPSFHKCIKKIKYQGQWYSFDDKWQVK